MQPDPLFRENMAVLAPDFVDVLEWRRLFDALLDGDPRRDFGTYALELTIEPLFRQIKSSEAIMAVLAGDETVVLCQLTGAQRDMVAALRAGNAELFLGHARRVIAEFEETESFQHLRGRLGDVA